jgi:bacillithiol biosynthesis cysteine-adding enzyme BshC
VDYVQEAEALRPFFNHSVSPEGIEASIKNRLSFSSERRKLLVNELTKQYAGITFTKKQSDYLSLLKRDNTFTVTTAHQPNIFTGPLYFIYKIIHVIKLADELSLQMKAYNFVPIYYMGSEDADLDELGYINLSGQKLTWATKQTGAVGRMKVDNDLLKLIDTIYGQIGVEPYGKELTDLFKKCYTLGKTIQQATLELVNALFADFGLLILIPDNAELKRSFEPVIKKELTEQFSRKAVDETIALLEKNYKVQAGGRDLNLFYLLNDKRERIEKHGDLYKAASLSLSFSQAEILQELKNNPERFSANVILRGVFQETVLPNIIFVGGGGELAYWLELKKVFEAVNVPYPMLILRNSFLLTNKNVLNKIARMDFSVQDFFSDTQSLLNTLVKRKSKNKPDITDELKEADNLYRKLYSLASDIDITLGKHVESLQAKSFKRLKELEKKMLRAEKRKFETEKLQIEKIKSVLFPNNSLQERTDNFSGYYAKSGKKMLQNIYDASKGLDQKFCVLWE